MKPTKTTQENQIKSVIMLVCNNGNGNGNEFIQRIFYWHIQMRFTSKGSMGENGHQHIQAPLAAAISPLANLTQHMNE